MVRERGTCNLCFQKISRVIPTALLSLFLFTSFALTYTGIGYVKVDFHITSFKTERKFDLLFGSQNFCFVFQKNIETWNCSFIFKSFGARNIIFRKIKVHSFCPLLHFSLRNIDLFAVKIQKMEIKIEKKVFIG